MAAPLLALASGTLLVVIALLWWRLRAWRAQAQARERQIADLFDHHPAPMWIFEMGSYRFLAVNDAAIARYGYPREEFLQMTLLDIRPSDERVALQQKRTTTSEAGYGDAGVWRHRTRSGELVQMHITLNKVRFDGKAAALVMARDVTADVQAREALSALNDTLEERVARRTLQLQRANAELEAFARTVAHDLKTPLNGIAGMTRLALMRLQAGQGDKEVQGWLGHALTAADSMAALVDGLLALSRVSLAPVKREPVDLSALSRQLLAQLREREPWRKVQVQVAEGLHAHADRALLLSLMSNLLSNAWKYTARQAEARVEVGARPAGPGPAQFFVRDNGLGFAAEEGDSLFHPFKRLQNARDFEGNGVGLATCQRVVQRHGGEIHAEGRPGQGATFWFTLEHAPQPVAAAESAGR